MGEARRRGALRLALALGLGVGGALSGCPGGHGGGGAGAGAGGAGAGGGARTDAPDVARVGADGAALPARSDDRPRPTLTVEVAPALDAKHVVAALRRAAAEGFGNFRLHVAGKEPGPVFGFDVLHEEKERVFTEPGVAALTAAPATAAGTASGAPAGPSAPAPGARPRTPDELAAALAAKVPPLKVCWEKILRRRPLPEAKISIYVRIDPAGRVAEARVDAASVKDDELSACLLARVRTFTFAPAADESEVLFPVVFTASGSPAEFPIAVALGGRTIAVTDSAGEEHSFHSASDLLADDVRRVIAEATTGPERAPRADLLAREGLRAGMLDLALRLLEAHARELRVVALE